MTQSRTSGMSSIARRERSALTPRQPPRQRAGINPRTRLLLEGAHRADAAALAWPNILVMVAQASTGLIETWFVSRLGTDALAGMALVFPGFMMMQMLSAGAVGGGISSAIARALGARPTRGRRRAGAACDHHQPRARASLFSCLFLVFGRALYRAMGGEGASLEAALPIRTWSLPAPCWSG